MIATAWATSTARIASAIMAAFQTRQLIVPVAP
jgi:hypothetical protein